jgi:hypothetical protein
LAAIGAAAIAAKTKAKSRFLAGTSVPDVIPNIDLSGILPTPERDRGNDVGGATLESSRAGGDYGST